MATSAEPKVAKPLRLLPLCLDCNYSLRGLAESRCPECGREFNIQDPTSFNNARPLRWIDRKLLKPIGWPMFTAIGLVCGWYLYLVANLGIHYHGVHIFLGMALFFGISVLLVVRNAVAFMILPRSIPRPSAKHRHKIALAIFGITFLLVILHVPMRILFFLAKPELDRTAQGIIDGKISRPIYARVAGPIIITSNQWYGDDDQYFFMIHGMDGGFAYCRTPDRPLYYSSGADGHLWGNWYWWTDD
jgi:hypothetical protein